jgi:hypothetical protein
MLSFRKSPQVRYVVLNIGANRTPGAQPLLFAEAAASGLRRTFIGGAGPVGDRDALLLLNPTRRDIARAFEAARLSEPDFFALTFDGHGSPRGIGVRDGLMSYEHLREEIDSVGAVGALTIIDSCYSGSLLRNKIAGLSGLDPDFDHVLGMAKDGVRVLCGSLPQQASWHVPALKGPAFTWALRRAMLSCSSDLPRGLVSAQRIAVATAEIMGRLNLPQPQTPMTAGSLRDFPICRGQDRVLGTAEFADAMFDGGNFRLQLRTGGRRFLPTYLTWRAANANGRVLDTGKVQLKVTQDDEGFDCLIPLPAAAVSRDLLCRQLTYAGRRIPISYSVTVDDHLERPIGGEVFRGALRWAA